MISQSKQGRRIVLAATAFALFILGVGPFVGQTPAPPGGLLLSWPEVNPRVVFEKEISASEPERRRWFFSRVTGTSREPLFSRPHGAAWDGSSLLVTDPGARRVVRLDDRSIAGVSPHGIFASPIGVAACSWGLVVTDSQLGRVARLDRDLDFVGWLAEGLNRPTGVACRDSHLFVAETASHRIQIFEFSEDRQSLTSITAIGTRGPGPREFNYPTSITLDGTTLWIGDALNFRVQALDLDSLEFERSFGVLGDASGEMPRMKGLAVDKHGRLWVSDERLNEVALFARDGTFLMSFGGFGAVNGRFSFPAGIAVSNDGRVAVVDSLNRRIQTFKSLNPSE